MYNVSGNPIQTHTVYPDNIINLYRITTRIRSDIRKFMVVIRKNESNATVYPDTKVTVYGKI